MGSTVIAVEAIGKNLLIRFDNGLELRTHLRMNGSWHRYRPGERWRRPPARARLVLEVPGAVAVCFDAPVVELFETRAETLPPGAGQARSGSPGGGFRDGRWGRWPAEALRRLRDPARAGRSIAEALLDQRTLAGIGNVYKSEVLFIERVDPWARIGELPDETVARLVGTARRLLLANADRRRGVARVTTGGDRAAAGQPLWVYGRAGRPCRRCGTLIERRRQGSDLPRLTYWCRRCQAGG